MEREIKFKGKSIDSDDWYYGTLLIIPHPPVCFGKEEKDKYYIQFADPHYIPDWGLPYKMVQGEVIPETVCEMTIFEVDDEELYEKDIIKFKDENKVERIGEVYLSTYEIDLKCVGYWGVRYKADNVIVSTALCDILDCATKIIGNQIDNKELLE